MKKKLTTTEVTGVIMLAVLVAAITSAAFLLKNCSGVQSIQSPEVRVEILDTLATPVNTREAGRDINKKSAKKSKKRKAGKKVKSESRQGKVKDPFSDTIPKLKTDR